MTRRFGPGICLGWRARTWRGLWERPRKPTASKAIEEPMRRTWMIVGTVLLVLSGCKRSAEPEGTLFVSGRIDGDTVDISSKIAGRIENLSVREGDSVKPGQVLAWLSSPQQEAIRDTQKARIVSDQRKLDQLRRQL